MAGKETWYCIATNLILDWFESHQCASDIKPKMNEPRINNTSFQTRLQGSWKS